MDEIKKELIHMLVKNGIKVLIVILVVVGISLLLLNQAEYTRRAFVLNHDFAGSVGYQYWNDRIYNDAQFDSNPLAAFNISEEQVQVRELGKAISDNKNEKTKNISTNSEID